MVDTVHPTTCGVTAQLWFFTDTSATDARDRAPVADKRNHRSARTLLQPGCAIALATTSIADSRLIAPGLADDR